MATKTKTSSEFGAMLRKTNDLSSLIKKAEALETSQASFKDDTYWKPELDKAGNGMAVIRFLPAPKVDGEDGLPWVRFFDHGFQGPGGWYIEKSRTSIGEDDPCTEYNSVLWATGIESNKDIVRKRKRRLKYVSNVLVISDPKNPQNEGKVFRFQYGKKIWAKISEAMRPPPEFTDEIPFNPFDFLTGANFKLKMKKVEGFPNYDKSEFEKPSELFDGDEDKLEEIWTKSYSLKEIVDPKNFKSYDELKARLIKVLGNETIDSNSSPTKTVPISNEQATKTASTVIDDDEEDNEDNSALAKFKALTEGDD